MTLIADQLMKALDMLQANQPWRCLLAENLNWASCEALLQSSLLWAFNAQEQTAVIADREKKITGSGKQGTKPDLLVFKVTDREEWGQALKKTPTDRRTLRRLGLAFVYKKIVWSNESATGSAKIESKAIEVVEDIGHLRAIRGMADSEGFNSPEKELFINVLLVCFRREEKISDGILHIDECEKKLLEQVSTTLQKRGQALYSKLKECWLLNAEAVPSSPWCRVFAKSVLLSA